MNFLFLVLKKIASALLLPLPIALGLAILGLIIAWFSSYIKTGLTLITLAVIILGIFCLDMTSQNLLLGLESAYSPLLTVPKNVNSIVVLGGGNGSDNHYPANTRIGAASLSRLVEGVRLYRQIIHQNPNAKLILSGGRLFRYYPEAGRLKNTAVALGVDPSHIVVENGSQDTLQEAIYLKPLLGEQPFILVTSAYHMDRSMRLFEKQGLHPIAAPTQFLTQMSRDPIRNFIPNSMSLVASDTALHEYFGLFWAKIKNTV